MIYDNVMQGLDLRRSSAQFPTYLYKRMPMEFPAAWGLSLMRTRVFFALLADLFAVRSGTP